LLQLLTETAMELQLLFVEACSTPAQHSAAADHWSNSPSLTQQVAPSVFITSHKAVGQWAALGDSVIRPAAG
jgi:hypothetical protein